MNDRFEFIYLNWLDRSYEKDIYTESRKIYWLDYPNIQSLVKDIAPVKVVFMGIEGPAVLLNHYCRKQKIPTFYLQHGIFHPYAAYLEEERMEKSKVIDAGIARNNPILPVKSLKRFLLKSFSLRMMNAYYTLIKFKSIQKFRNSKQRAFFYTKTFARTADRYLVFTKFSSRVLAERDGVSDDRLIETGNPEADAILTAAERSASINAMEQPYYLLIDDPFGETPDYVTDGFFSKEVILQFHKRLNAYCLSKNHKLAIKLHPDNYRSTWLSAHENIIYYRDADLSPLFANAKGIFGGLSTLLIPALRLRPAVLFSYNDRYDLHRFARNTGFCRVLNYFDFSADEIVFNETERQSLTKEFVSAWLYKDDRKAADRIANALAG